MRRSAVDSQAMQRRYLRSAMWTSGIGEASCRACAAATPRRTPTSSSAPSSTTSGRRSRCCCSPASTCSASRGCGSRRPRSCSPLWRRPWRASARSTAPAGGCSSPGAPCWRSMNCCFYIAIDRLPLGTVAAIEFLPVIVLAALGARTPRNAVALALAVPGVYLLTGVQLEGEPLGLALAFANAVLLRRLHRARRPRREAARACSGIDGLGAAMLVAAVVVTPIGGWAAAARARRPGRAARGRRRRHLLVGDPLRRRPARACARLPRATYALMVALLPATATIIGVVVLAQMPSAARGGRRRAGRGRRRAAPSPGGRA